MNPFTAPVHQKLLAPTFLFRFAAPCRHQKKLWSANGAELAEKHRIPSFGELEGRPLFADVRTAWNEDGIAFLVRVSGKKQSPWCRETRPDDSDGVHLWIDTRDVHDIHRAGRFCHRITLLPFGSGRGLEEPSIDLPAIRRARENPKPVPEGAIRISSERRVGGYILHAHIASRALTGWDPEEHPRLGFTYAVVDRELGWQTFSVGSEFPFQDDPSLWGTLDLVR